MKEKKGAKPEVEETPKPEGELSDDALDAATGGALPSWWIEGTREALKKTDPSKIIQ